MPELVTAEMITRAQAGDASAIGDLFEYYHLGVYRYLYYRVGDAQIAEDLASDVFLRMMKAIHSYRPQSVPFEAWLLQIARNLAIDHLRKMRIRNHASLEEVSVASDMDTATAAEHRLTSGILVRAISQLNESQRDVIVLRFVNCLPIAQVARMLHKSEDAIKGLQRRGLEALRDILNDWEVSYE